MIKIIKFLFIITFLTTTTLFSQEKKEATLFDEFGEITCCDLHARTDALVVELMQNPTSMGYVQIFGDSNNPLKVLYLEISIKGSFLQLESIYRRIKIVRSTKEDKLRARFWIVPKGASVPEFEEKQYQFPLDKSIKPFMFFTTEDYGHCPKFGYHTAFIELLKSNPEAKANLVIHEKNRAEFYKTKKELIESFSDISLNRLRFFYVKKEYDNIEYWIVPKKKRN